MLRLEIARFSAINAIVLAVLTEADIVLSHAKSAEAVTFAFLFGLVALGTMVLISHG